LFFAERAALGSSSRNGDSGSYGSAAESDKRGKLTRGAIR
jgi:hypothetical protein